MENKMTTAQFTERYCPDYEEKKRKLNVLKSKANTPKYSMERGEICRQKKNLSASMFAEAAENFRQAVWREACEAMRKRCQERLDEAYEYGNSDYERLSRFDELYRGDLMILDTPAPEFPKNE